MKNIISPHDFLKLRRPHKFSDSFVIKNAKLSREFLDFYLNSLTSRSQEKLFEHFCQRMAELEICPNLITQTGPTGGGDSKVDSETYPVSDDTAMSWYSGIGREASSERWAFAISAKHDWRAKIKSDVIKIISTNRGYKKIFFMSNQFISDKKRANLEDEFSELYKVDVRILDRNWLLDKIFLNHRERVAVEVFGLSDDFIDVKKIGPLDYGRNQELNEIEKEIINFTSAQRFDLTIVDKSIRAAILSRELELPLVDTMGRFYRASTLSAKYGTDNQKKECSYQCAWSLYWWYEEYDDFLEKYCEYERLAVGTISFYDIERLTNLWMNLYVIKKGNHEDENFRAHTDILMSEYERLISDGNRPNTAFEAKANFIFVKLFLGFDIDQAAKELNEVINDCSENIDFSFETIANILTELAPTMEDSSAFEELFENVVTIIGNRKQEIVSSQMLLSRGQQLVETKPYSAIKYLGRALILLYKEETKNELLIALYLIAFAHEKVDLQWSARGFYLNAFYFAFIDYMKYGILHPVMVACSARIKMLELSQGRIRQAIDWNELNTMSRRLISSIGYDVEKIQKVDLFDSILGMLFFRISFEDLPKLTKLPDALDKNGLHLSAIALKYTLGYIDEEIQEANMNDESIIDDFMAKWYNQPAKEQIPDSPVIEMYCETISTKILGCKVSIEAEREFPCIELAESILAAIESFLATGIPDKIISYAPALNMKIRYVENNQFTIYCEKELNDDTMFCTIFCSDFNSAEFIKAQINIKEFIRDLIAELIARIVIFHDLKQLEIWAREDRVFDRALHFNNSIFVTEDLVGKNKNSIESLITGEEFNYVLKREESIKTKCNTVNTETEGSSQEICLESCNPERLFNPEKIGHKNVEISSVINMDLWNKALWKGMLFAFSPGQLPIIAPIFTNIEAGKAIFEGWRKVVGKRDEKDLIKVGLIKSIDLKNPLSYKAIFTSNIELLPNVKRARYINIISRFQRMDSIDNRNLLMFEKIVKSVPYEWKYWLAPAYYDTKTGQPDMLLEYAIQKNSVTIKEAWEIGEYDWLSYAITLDDEPIIPQHVMKAPIANVIDFLKKFTPNKE